MIFQIKHYLKNRLREGKAYKKHLSFLMESQWWSVERIEDYQNSRLREMIRHCYFNVPYYKKVFDSLGITWEAIKTKDDLKKLPFLDKKTVSDNFNDLIAKNKNALFSVKKKTSGTTGTPGKFLQDLSLISLEQAFFTRHWLWAGYNNSKIITLRGEIVVAVDRKNPPFWKYDPFNKELFFSSYHLNKQNARQIIKKIKQFQPEFLYAYPSTASLLANLFNDWNERYQLKAVITSSETLLEPQKNIISDIFNCAIFDWYGNTERVAAIGQCEEGSYHEIPEYSILEYHEHDHTYELIGTQLNNYIMPLIRYRCGDLAEPDNNNCTCGRYSRIAKKIQGRMEDYIILADGRKLGRLDHIFKDVSNVVESQIIQKKLGEINFKIVKNRAFSKSDEDSLKHNISRYIGTREKINIEYVEEIPKGSSGKFKAVLNEMKIDS